MGYLKKKIVPHPQPTARKPIYNSGLSKGYGDLSQLTTSEH